MGKWREVSWRYEKFDGNLASEEKRIDGIRFPGYTSRRLVRHEAEWWEFLPGRVLIIHKRDGEQMRARWRLKGRGHVLVIRYADSDDAELYDVKELTEDSLVLNYDIGMEVRGIAQLGFRRLGASEEGADPSQTVSNGANPQ